MADLNALYQQYLGRAPDPSGIATWSGQDEASIIAGILGSQEYQQNQGGGGGGGGEPAPQSNTEVVNQLYRDILGREADPDSAGWVRLLDAGYTPAQVAAQIGSSQEAQNKAMAGVNPGLLANDPNNFGGIITQLYASALGRLPDAPTLEADINLLNQNPDAFQWIAQNVTQSPEAQAYAQRSGINLDSAYENALQSYGKWTPSPEQGGIGGFFNKLGPWSVPLAALAFTGIGSALGAGAAGAGGAAAGGAAGAGGAGALTTAEILGSTGFIPTAGSSFGIVPGAAYTAAGLGSVGQALPYTTAYDAANLYGQGLSQAAIEQNLAMTGIDPFLAADAATLASQGLSEAAIAQNLSYGYTPAELAGTGIESMALESAAGTGIDNLLSSLGSALKTPLGQLGVRGGLGLLSGGGSQQAVPQMAAGTSTYAPKGQVDYTPILNLLAPKQIARSTNSLLG